MSTILLANEMLHAAENYALAGLEFAKQFPLSQLAKDFNGIGPEFFPDRLRKFIDKLCYVFLPAAFVHDVRWSHSDGTTAQFLRSNEELELNCRILAYANYAWYNPMRYLRLHQAKVFRRLCDLFGYAPYRTAYVKSQAQNNK